MKHTKSMKLGIVIPDRNDRPAFIENSFRMLKAQTLQPTIVEHVNFEPKSETPDITTRYRIGYEKLRGKVDLIAFWENDDWYSNMYLEYMVKQWLERGEPELLGLDYTIYYHLRECAYFIFHHSERSSAMSTLIKPDLNFNWCRDEEPYTDMHLWTNTPEIKSKIIFHPEKHLTIGMKHGVGLCGGIGHLDLLHIFTEKDPEKLLLKEIMDEESFKFYSSVVQPFTKKTLKIINGNPVYVPE